MTATQVLELWSVPRLSSLTAHRLFCAHFNLLGILSLAAIILSSKIFLPLLIYLTHHGLTCCKHHKLQHCHTLECFVHLSLTDTDTRMCTSKQHRSTSPYSISCLKPPF
eukprot:c15517_g1_i1 orf=228-554(-)